MPDLIDKINEVIGRFTIGEISRAQAHFELELLDERLGDRVDIDYELLHYRVVRHPDDADEDDEKEEVYNTNGYEDEGQDWRHQLDEDEIAALKERREESQVAQAEYLKQQEAQAAARLKQKEAEEATRLAQPETSGTPPEDTGPGYEADYWGNPIF
jgi:hypothetical protein